MTRRAILAALACAALDPERLLWRPGKKLISVPSEVIWADSMSEVWNAPAGVSLIRLTAKGIADAASWYGGWGLVYGNGSVAPSPVHQAVAAGIAGAKSVSLRACTPVSSLRGEWMSMRVNADHYSPALVTPVARGWAWEYDSGRAPKPSIYSD